MSPIPVPTDFTTLSAAAEGRRPEWPSMWPFG